MYAAPVEVIEHADEVAQAAGQAVKFPDNERVAVLQRLEATEQGRALGGGSLRSSLNTWHLARLKAASCKAGFCSSVETRA